MDANDWKRRELESHDKARLEDRASRAARTNVHGIIPGEFFSKASSECRDAFIDGHFYACISLSQTVAEGLSRFLGEIHKVGAPKDPQKRVERLCSSGVITDTARDAFGRIWGSDRNTFHHLNRDVPTDHGELERRAEDCVNALLEIESEVFAYDVSDGKIAPKHPEYWPKTDDQHLGVFLRLGGY